MGSQRVGHESSDYAEDPSKYSTLSLRLGLNLEQMIICHRTEPLSSRNLEYNVEQNIQIQ